jgi:glycosyltransferase involved in cell wall biosynthesis
MRQTRIAHVTTVDVSLRYLLLNQLQSLQQSGYQVTGISSPGPEVAVLRTAGIRHIAVPMARTPSPVADLVSLWRLYRLMRRERFTIVHTHTPKAGLLGQLAARLAGVPIVVNTLHGFYFHERMRPAARRFYIAMEKIAALCSSSILSQNQEDIETAIRERICPANKISHLGNGIDLTCFDRRHFSQEEISRARGEIGLPECAPVVGFVGRLAGRRKGFLDFLAAARQVSAQMPATRFLIIGEADHGKPDAVEPGAARECGVEDVCLFLGHRPNKDLPLLYALMDVLVLPSLFEGIPRVIMEAAAMGIPAIATDVKGNREVVEHGRTGLLVPYGDPQALAHAILRILTNPEEARAMGQQSRCMAAECFDEQEVFATIKAEYTRLLRERGLQPRQTRAATNMVQDRRE